VKSDHSEVVGKIKHRLVLLFFFRESNGFYVVTKQKGPDAVHFITQESLDRF
jgi:hypothetical protein